MATGVIVCALLDCAVLVCAGIGLLAGPLLAALIVCAPKGRAAVHWSVVYGAGASVRSRVVASVAACLALTPLGLLPTVVVPVAVVVVLAGVVLAAIDIRLHRLPDLVVLPAVALTVVVGVASAIGYDAIDRLLPMLLTGAGLFGGCYLIALAAPSAFGFGDVKLAALIGLAIGQIAPSLLLVWGVLLAPAAVVSIIAERLVVRDRPARGLKTQVAFGPVMLGAVWLLYLLVALRA
ncbi:leader peptidase (prepilin peptidase)/N-methyltransferase [Antricoccus suffuscus]|uniref:Leader peptidase (Prepilin peptidase)/N-methyltransferase n=1 Tax=Antricoccus suffuscus TaxID=1629062 RepID=A0A2T0ZW91_9ACTN|nr:prepilin peptidase [Antricoccus suffuscus]PRZ40635.1 leader peptidase (prepilin peptidase)/N-methyltransferase [Antricoccus suffuscus]